MWSYKMLRNSTFLTTGNQSPFSVAFLMNCWQHILPNSCFTAKYRLGILTFANYLISVDSSRDRRIFLFIPSFLSNHTLLSADLWDVAYSSVSKATLTQLRFRSLQNWCRIVNRRNNSKKSNFNHFLFWFCTSFMSHESTIVTLTLLL